MSRNSRKSLSKAGRDKLKTYEGKELRSYRDSGGVWTIGYGHTGPDVGPGQSITQEEADRLYKQDTAWASNAVANNIRTPLTQPQFDALTSFTYNVGPGWLSGSGLKRALDEGRKDAVPAELGKWVYDNGNLVPGLVNRRNHEIELWGSPLDVTQSPEARPSVESPQMDLRPGDAGPEVAALQTQLRSMGHYTGEVDGDYGEQTAAAVAAAQAAVGRDATGVADVATLNDFQEVQSFSAAPVAPVTSSADLPAPVRQAAIQAATDALAPKPPQLSALPSAAPITPAPSPAELQQAAPSVPLGPAQAPLAPSVPQQGIQNASLGPMPPSAPLTPMGEFASVDEATAALGGANAPADPAARMLQDATAPTPPALADAAALAADRAAFDQRQAESRARLAAAVSSPDMAPMLAPERPPTSAFMAAPQERPPTSAFMAAPEAPAPSSMPTGPGPLSAPVGALPAGPSSLDAFDQRMAESRARLDAAIGGLKPLSAPVPPTSGMGVAPPMAGISAPNPTPGPVPMGVAPPMSGVDMPAPPNIRAAFSQPAPEQPPARPAFDLYSPNAVPLGAAPRVPSTPLSPLGPGAPLGPLTPSTPLSPMGPRPPTMPVSPSPGISSLPPSAPLSPVQPTVYGGIGAETLIGGAAPTPPTLDKMTFAPIAPLAMPGAPPAGQAPAPPSRVDVAHDVINYPGVIDATPPGGFIAPPPRPLAPAPPTVPVAAPPSYQAPAAVPTVQAAPATPPPVPGPAMMAGAPRPPGPASATPPSVPNLLAAGARMLQQIGGAITPDVVENAFGAARAFVTQGGDRTNGSMGASNQGRYGGGRQYSGNLAGNYNGGYNGISRNGAGGYGYGYGSSSGGFGGLGGWGTMGTTNTTNDDDGYSGS